MSPDRDRHVIYVRPGPQPWHVITVAARLAARLLEAEYVEVGAEALMRQPRRALGLLPRRRGRGTCIVIAPEPWAMRAVLHARHWTRGYERVAVWVIDSWWDDRIPHVARTSHVDTVFVTERENIDVWRRTAAGDVHWLPQGTNALDWGSATASRDVDLLRVGRQPTQWSDDEVVRASALEHGLTFAGRPPFSDAEPEDAMATLMARYASAKFVLAFGNAHSPASYTHPTTEYLTGRWTDSLASGAVVAGVPPDCASTDELLWDGALLDIGTTDLAAGMEHVRAALEGWTPERAQHNYDQALRRLDWRWRISSMAATLGITTPTLAAEMMRLRTAVDGDGPSDSTSALAR